MAEEYQNLLWQTLVCALLPWGPVPCPGSPDAGWDPRMGTELLLPQARGSLDSRETQGSCPDVLPAVFVKEVSTVDMERVLSQLEVFQAYRALGCRSGIRARWP